MLCMSYRFDKGPVHLWVPVDDLPEETVIAPTREQLRDKAILHFGSRCPPLVEHICGAEEADHERTTEARHEPTTRSSSASS
jgi:hypothetical protein